MNRFLVRAPLLFSLDFRWGSPHLFYYMLHRAKVKPFKTGFHKCPREHLLEKLLGINFRRIPRHLVRRTLVGRVSQNHQNGILDFRVELYPELRTTITYLIEIKSWINRHTKIPFCDFVEQQLFERSAFHLWYSNSKNK